MQKQPTIGILGGMGPQAGLDLFQAVLDNTVASRDQEHIPTLLSSAAHIPDRTTFLLHGERGTGSAPPDPAPHVGSALVNMAEAGATVAAIACNTAHAGPIFDRVQEHVRAHAPGLRLLHMIEETVASIGSATGASPGSGSATGPGPGSGSATGPGPKIGILATAGTYHFRLYDDALEAAGFECLRPEADFCKAHLFPAIYDPGYGIKATSTPVSERAAESVAACVEHLLEKGAEKVILGCTELPLAIDGHHRLHPYVVNPTRVVARALIRATYPVRLRSGQTGRDRERAPLSDLKPC